MNGLYAETCVKKKATIGTHLAKVGIVVAVVLLFLVATMLGGSGALGYFLMLLASILVVGLFVIIPRFNMDYEYIFCDGQIDFDAIVGGNKRKNKLRIDFENLEIMAPEKSHRLDSYRNEQIKTKDFSSREANAVRYMLVVRVKDERVKVIFEPDEKMIDCARQKSPRKVFLD